VHKIITKQPPASKSPTYAPTSREYFANLGTLLMVQRYRCGHPTHGATLSFIKHAT